MYHYHADIIKQEELPTAYGKKGNKLDLTMMRFIRCKDWDAKTVDALVTDSDVYHNNIDEIKRTAVLNIEVFQ